jgi:hypothetical protein
MPDIKNKITGEIVESHPYTPQGQAKVSAKAAANPNLEVSFNPGGEYNAMNRNEMRMGYAEGGKVNKYYGGGRVNPINTVNPVNPTILPEPTVPMYKHGGKVKKK